MSRVYQTIVTVHVRREDRESGAECPYIRSRDFLLKYIPSDILTSRHERFFGALQGGEKCKRCLLMARS